VVWIGDIGIAEGENMVISIDFGKRAADSCCGTGKLSVIAGTESHKIIVNVQDDYPVNYVGCDESLREMLDAGADRTSRASHDF
jgi:ubiquinone/menaquinone biosynthesis C-methylase UbiE